MKSLFLHAFTLTLAGAAVVLTGCADLKMTHVAPGESLYVATAKKADLIKLPATAPSSVVAGAIPAVEPALPDQGIVERVGEAYSRGEFCMSVGKDAEAISAFEEAVKIDPGFTEAWQQLAVLYEKSGDSKKAMQAFRAAKKVAQH